MKTSAPSNVSSRLISGRSLFENCGPYVIVEEARLEQLESAAEVIRESLGRASRANTLRELIHIMDALPYPSLLHDALTILEDGGFFDDQAVDLKMKPPTGAYEKLVETVFFNSAIGDYFENLSIDTTDCYLSVSDIPALKPYLSFARMDDDAGIDDLAGAMKALNEAGYVCVRDDERIRHCYEHLMSDTYLRGLEQRVN